MTSSTASIAGISQTTRTGDWLGSQTRIAMFSTMKTSNASAGGQRDSPIGWSVDTSVAGGDVAASPVAVTQQIVAHTLQLPATTRMLGLRGTPARSDRDGPARARNRRYRM